MSARQTSRTRRDPARLFLTADSFPMVGEDGVDLIVESGWEPCPLTPLKLEEVSA